MTFLYISVGLLVIAFFVGISFGLIARNQYLPRQIIKMKNGSTITFKKTDSKEKFKGYEE